MDRYNPAKDKERKMGMTMDDIEHFHDMNYGLDRDVIRDRIQDVRNREN